jgi:predicted dehydrogenase
MSSWKNRRRSTWRKDSRWWQSGSVRKERWGKPADEPVPAGLDWDLWLGPAPKVPFNRNRWGVEVARFPTFRYFWDYAGGAMTDWGVHLIDPVHQCYGEPMLTSVSAMGGKLYVDDNAETPDTMLATFRYPKFLLTYESRTANPMPMFGHGAATSIHGTEGTLVVNRGGCYVTPNEKSAIAPVHLREGPRDERDERAALEELHRVRPNASEAGQRHRDLRAVVDAVHPCQPVHAPSDVA